MSDVLAHCAGLPEKVFPAGSTILVDGGKDKRLLILISGTVEISKDGMPISIVSQPGAFFGEIAVLLDTPHMASVRAADEVRMYESEDGCAFLTAHPELSLGVARLVARRLRQVTAYLTDVQKQFEDRADHLGIIEEVLQTLINDQPEDQTVTPGSDREYEPNM